MGRAALLAAAVALAVAPAVACSSEETDASPPDDAITIRMTDNAYSPGSVDVSKGETVTFEFVNEGRVTHEAFIGDEQAQEDHAADMTGDDHHSMDMGGDEVIKVEPGASGSVTRTFDEDGSVLIGCHQPGHWESGMKATVEVG